VEEQLTATKKLKRLDKGCRQAPGTPLFQPLPFISTEMCDMNDNDACVERGYGQDTARICL
jgi:hypothetical protein